MSHQKNLTNGRNKTLITTVIGFESRMVNLQLTLLHFKHFSATNFIQKCAKDRDLYKLVSCCKFFLLTLGHHALAVILCLCLNFFLSYQELNSFDKAKEA
jgi:hypothetical protein